MSFSQHLLKWYRQNKRDLPWRNTRDPYLIWLSEIILQQTRVEQGRPYYLRFAGKYPTVQHLAAADEQEVLKLWQGLGYYTRARNLHAAAKMIVEVYAGEFPGSYAAIRGLKGIGDYTAAAIASICFDLPVPVVDGNVIRFITRMYGIAEPADQTATLKRIREIAAANIDSRNPGDFNQAMMEFGATVCTPSAPGCVHCVFNDRCIAYKMDAVGSIPARKVKPALRQRFLHYLVITARVDGNECVYLNRRAGSGIWKNLYDFPCLERPGDKRLLRLTETDFTSLLNFTPGRFTGISAPHIHVLTHQKLHARFYRYHSDDPLDLPYLPVPLKDIQKYPVPRLIEKYVMGGGGLGNRS
jgi:A/G-specific adenine glycosylase